MTFAILISFYFMPTIIAGAREHKNTGAIAVLNLLLGWTGLGWVGAMVWAFTAQPPKVIGGPIDRSRWSKRDLAKLP